jgi:biotin-(acetyl-CoA carboxylase) ligase
MLYLTDQTGPTRAFIPATARATGDPLTAADQSVALYLGCNSPLTWYDDNNHEDAARVVIIDQANGSQFDAIVDALKSGQPWPDTVFALALTGRGFRGQRNRPWTALRGNLHFTASFKLRAPVRDIEAGLVALPAVAVMRAIEEGTGMKVQPRVKWVNDVMIEQRKVAGVLTSTQVQGDAVTSAVFGIGLNIEQRPSLPAQPSSPEPGALAQADPRSAGKLAYWFRLLTMHLRDGVRELLESGSAPLVQAYRERTCFLGQPVRIWPEDPEAGEASPLACGIVRALNADLSLSLDNNATPIRHGRMELPA